MLSQIVWEHKCSWNWKLDNFVLPTVTQFHIQEKLHGEICLLLGSLINDFFRLKHVFHFRTQLLLQGVDHWKFMPFIRTEESCKLMTCAFIERNLVLIQKRSFSVFTALDVCPWRLLHLTLSRAFNNTSTTSDNSFLKYCLFIDSLFTDEKFYSFNFGAYNCCNCRGKRVDKKW